MPGQSHITVSSSFLISRVFVLKYPVSCCICLNTALDSPMVRQLLDFIVDLIQELFAVLSTALLNFKGGIGGAMGPQNRVIFTEKERNILPYPLINTNVAEYSIFGITRRLVRTSLRIFSNFSKMMLTTI